MLGKGGMSVSQTFIFLLDSIGDGRKVHGRTVVLTAGTFLRGTINIGLSVRQAGRMGDEPAVGLAKSLEEAGFTMGRLKTGKMVCLYVWVV